MCISRIKSGLLVAAIGLSLPAPAQESPFRVASQKFVDEQGGLNYVAPLQALQENKARFNPEVYRQVLSTYRSFVGLMPAPQSAVAIPVEPYQLTDPLPTLRTRAQAATVVLINEAHDQPAHRAYAQRVLQELRPLGYSLLAVEALDPADTAFTRRGVPLAASGFYTREPAMARLLRGAAQTGYHVFGHEITEAQEREFEDMARRTNYRDSMQAVNLLAELRRHPGAKLVAVVGYDHVLEKPRDGITRLGAWLHQLAGIDPLTVDQTTDYAPQPGQTLPQLLTTDGRTPATTGENAGYVDLQLVHPPVTLVNGRPSWLAAYGGGRARTSKVRGIKSQTTLVQLFDAQELAQYGERAIPLDQCLIDVQHPKVTLFVPEAKRKVEVRYWPLPFELEP